MRRLIFVALLTTALSFADVTCNTPNNVLLNQGTVNNLVGNGASAAGCLSVGSTVAGANNQPADGLFVHPTTGNGMPNFQSSGLDVAWTVSSAGTGANTVYTYTYTFLDSVSQTPAATISHIDIGLGTNCTSATTSASASSDCVYNLKVGTGGGTLNAPVGCNPCGSTYAGGPGAIITTNDAGLGNGNPDQPWNTETLEIGGSSSTDLTVQFKSKLAPVWQDVYVRDTQAGCPAGDQCTNPNAPNYFNNSDSTDEAWNHATFNNGATTSAVGFFEAAPGTPLPEPGFYGFMALGVAGLFSARRISRKSSSTT